MAHHTTSVPQPATPTRAKANDASANTATSEPRRRLLGWSLAAMSLTAAASSRVQSQAPTSTPTPAAAAPGAVEVQPPTEEVPYVQTPNAVVRRMLQLAEVGRNDRLWDLGSGDGRIVIAAARDFGARGTGYEIDPQLIAESGRRARKAGVAAATRFLERDLFTLSFAEPSVVTLYLLPEFNARLRPLLLAQMRPGSRVVSHEWDMGDWLPDETLLLRTPAKPHGLSREHKVMLWIVPATAAGRWQIELKRPGSAPQSLTVGIEQSLQLVTASANTGRVLWAGLRGRELSLAWQDGSARWLLSGTVSGRRWHGGVQAIAQWSNTNDEIVGRFSAQLL